MAEQRTAELMEPAVGEFHLRFDADSPRDPGLVGSTYEVREQCALADPGFAAEGEDSARSAQGVTNDAVERRAFASSSEELHACRRPRQTVPLRGNPIHHAVHPFSGSMHAPPRADQW